MTLRLYDAHCHLQDPRLAPALDAALARAAAVGVRGFLCCGTQEADWPAVAGLAERLPGVRPAFGIHPWFAAGRSAGWRDDLAERLTRNPAAAVGEIGLDRARADRDDADQRALFREQVRLAIELGRTMSVHCRGAWDTLTEILEELPGAGPAMVIHSYSGGAEQVGRLARLGAWFSFSGSVTFERHRRAREALAAVPADRLLLETDAPDLPPAPVRAAAPPDGPVPVNEPANLVWVLRAAAELRAVPVSDLADRVWENAQRLFCDHA